MSSSSPSEKFYGTLASGTSLLRGVNSVSNAVLQEANAAEVGAVVGVCVAGIAAIIKMLGEFVELRKVLSGYQITFELAHDYLTTYDFNVIRRKSERLLVLKALVKMSECVEDFGKSLKKIKKKFIVFQFLSATKANKALKYKHDRVNIVWTQLTSCLIGFVSSHVQYEQHRIKDEFFENNKELEAADAKAIEENRKLSEELNKKNIAARAIAKTREAALNKTKEIFDKHMAGVIKAQSSRMFWYEHFGSNTVAEFDKFILKLGEITDVDDEARKLLETYLSTDGNVQIQEFGNFVNNFSQGKLKNIAKVVKNVVNQDWYHGAMTFEVAEGLLKAQPEGTFLVRNGKSVAGTFVLAKSTEDKVVQKIISMNDDYKYIFDEEEFDSLANLISFLKRTREIKMSYTPKLESEDYWFGAVTAEHASELLEGKEPGVYMFRLSSMPNTFSLSFVNKKSKISHVRISRSVDGQKFFQTMKPDDFYSSLKDFIAARPSLLKKPLETDIDKLVVDSEDHTYADLG